MLLKMPFHSNGTALLLSATPMIPQFPREAQLSVLGTTGLCSQFNSGQ